MAVLTDAAIESLIRQPKLLLDEYRDILLKDWKDVGSHRRSELKVSGTENDVFIIYIRASNLNLFDFSAILGYEQSAGKGLFLLRRYNGRSHAHTNRIEGNHFRDFHIHFASERYQVRGFREEAYAEVTNRYSDIGGALDCLIADCGFVLPTEEHPPF
ncbi:MAG: hypothetical protein JNM70_04675 [Anaerolineae bacterium]|nr:hypothetical protein [Anaerolineae bacterium]